jgi:hypothetical protein
MNRRFFLQWASLGGLATLLPGCLKQLNASQVTANMAGVLPIPLAPKQAGIYIPVGTVSDLDRAGYLLNENTLLGAVMVVKDSLGQLKAVNPACPGQLAGRSGTILLPLPQCLVCLGGNRAVWPHPIELGNLCHSH